jgi:hypothetical protein
VARRGFVVERVSEVVVEARFGRALRDGGGERG